MEKEQITSILSKFGYEEFQRIERAHAQHFLAKHDRFPQRVQSNHILFNLEQNLGKSNRKYSNAD